MTKQYVVDPVCNDSRPCFGAVYTMGGFRTCRVLSACYEGEEECPFCKDNEADLLNMDIRKRMESSGFSWPKIAMEMGISNNYLHTMMNRRMSVRNKDRIIKAIKKLEKELENAKANTSGKGKKGT